MLSTSYIGGWQICILCNFNMAAILLFLRRFLHFINSLITPSNQLEMIERKFHSLQYLKQNYSVLGVTKLWISRRNQPLTMIDRKLQSLHIETKRLSFQKMSKGIQETQYRLKARLENYWSFLTKVPYPRLYSERSSE